MSGFQAFGIWIPFPESYTTGFPGSGCEAVSPTAPNLSSVTPKEG